VGTTSDRGKGGDEEGRQLETASITSRLIRFTRLPAHHSIRDTADFLLRLLQLLGRPPARTAAMLQPASRYIAACTVCVDVCGLIRECVPYSPVRQLVDRQQMQLTLGFKMKRPIEFGRTSRRPTSERRGWSQAPSRIRSLAPSNTGQFRPPTEEEEEIDSKRRFRHCIASGSRSCDIVPQDEERRGESRRDEVGLCLRRGGHVRTM